MTVLLHCWTPKNTVNFDSYIIISLISEHVCIIGRNQEWAWRGDKGVQRTWAEKWRIFRGFIRAKSELVYEVLMHASDEIFKNPCCWSNATSTESKHWQIWSSLQKPTTYLQCSEGSCNNCHSTAWYMTCNHFIVGPLTWSLTITRSCHCRFLWQKFHRQLNSVCLFSKLLEQQ